MITIVQHPELKCNATQVEIDDTRYLSCLSVVPLVMDTTTGGSRGIPPDPSLQTGRDEEERLNEWRLRLRTI